MVWYGTVRYGTVRYGLKVWWESSFEQLNTESINQSILLHRIGSGSACTYVRTYVRPVHSLSNELLKGEG